MNYDMFRTLWHEALATARLATLSFRPSETVELDGMSRTYKITVALSRTQQISPFYLTATFDWRWGAAHWARSATTEEDLLVEILGQDASYLITAQPWLRMNVTLAATVPLGSPLPMPGDTAWRRWMAALEARLFPLLPIDCKHGESLSEDGQRPQMLSAREEPEVRVRCEPNGRLCLNGVYLSAWQAIDLPRQWDDPAREPDDWPEKTLADLASRVRQALHEWEGSLQILVPH